MGEYVERDLAGNTPGIGKWKFDRAWPYKIPDEWLPDRPYYPVRDRGKPRKPSRREEEEAPRFAVKSTGDDADANADDDDDDD